MVCGGFSNFCEAFSFGRIFITGDFIDFFSSWILGLFGMFLGIMGLGGMRVL
jgi:hypothetical protein